MSTGSGKRAAGLYLYAVVRRAEMRAALDDFPGNDDVRLPRVHAGALVAAAGISGNAACLRGLVRMPWGVPVARPLPDVSRHVDQAVAVGRERADRRCAFIPVGLDVLPWELALPEVRHRTPARHQLSAPGVLGPFEPSARRHLPLGFGRERCARPHGVRLGVSVGDVHHRMAALILDGGTGPVRVAPVCAEDELPPVPKIPHVHRTARLDEDQRAGIQHVGTRPRILGGVRGDLSERHVTGFGDEPAEVGVGHRGAVHPESVDGHPVRRGLLWIMPIGTHQESPSWDPRHPRMWGNRRRGVPGRVVTCWNRHDECSCQGEGRDCG